MLRCAVPCRRVLMLDFALTFSRLLNP
jgi:hypothetical protein